ncbi:LuxR C-terminal-related transcriptional regulator [Dongia sp.]|uniref:LuxR C-terminal-related transcriptional regulator n=1 Tax=Dongia sp. TaxID=1977262 RepID=UPI0035AFE0D5
MPQPPSSHAEKGSAHWRLVLADDHALVRDAISQMLEALDSTLVVERARDLDEVAKLLASGMDITFLLLDYRMPGMNGAASIARIKSDYPAIPIGIISGLLSPEDVEPLIQAGAVGVFPKTMSGPALLMALKLALSGQIYVPWNGDLNAAPPSPGAPADQAESLPALTERQMEVLRLVASGAANKDIGQRLGLSEVTVKIHVAALCRKLSVANRTQLATTALRAGVKASDA